MKFRTLGKTGLKVSILGFGCMRLPIMDSATLEVDEDEAIKLIRMGIDGGINYVDTAYRYHGSKSEIILGKALKDGYREKVFIETKLFTPKLNKTEDFEKLLDEQLKKLDVKFIDIYLIHGLNYKRYQEKIVKLKIIEEARKAKELSKIKHLGFSSHDKPENIRKLIDTDFFEVMLVQYNLLHRDNGEIIKYAAEKGMGVILMGPNAGGRLGLKPPESMKKFLTPTRDNFIDLGFKFVWSNPGVTVALSGMGSEQMVRDNLEIASQENIDLKPDELIRIDNIAKGYKKIAEINCTQCGYCEPCNQEVNIRLILDLLMLSVGCAGDWEEAKAKYKLIGNHEKYHGKNAEACIECSECESRCPQEIPIVERIQQTHRLLTGLDSYNI
ncbi:MAG: aldo/keto reductase [Candidatus Heimdallarchaeota archaeon]|nr:aldo/keto reductase [Candidatus Heimdallarchaeota archaeon]